MPLSFIGNLFADPLENYLNLIQISKKMKKTKTLLIIVSALILSGAQPTLATVHNVDVEDFEFDPASFIANVGDTVNWIWDEGFHTTTSFIIPSGAATWDQPISSGTPFYSYVITVAGSYDYICSPHASMGMTGHFTVLGTTGIEEAMVPSLNLTKSYVSNGKLHFEFTAPGNEVPEMALYDLAGRSVLNEKLSLQGNSVQTHSVDVGALPKGLYLFYLQTGDSRLTRRIVIE